MKYSIYFATLLILGILIYQLGHSMAEIINLTSNIRHNLGAEMYDEQK